jgi:hypothetical protein
VAFVAVLIPAALVSLTAVAIVPMPLSLGARVIQHFQSLVIQTLAAALAAALAWRAATAGATLRAFWRRITLASVLSGAGIVAHGTRTMLSGGSSYPSAADVLLLGSLIAVSAALAAAGDATDRTATPRAWLPWLLGGGLWVVILAAFLWPAVVAAASRLAVTFNILAVTAPVVVLAQAVRLTRQRVRARGMWLGMAAVAALLVAEWCGTVYLRWLNVLSDVHPIVLARVGVFGLLAGIAIWDRDAGEAAAEFVPSAHPGGEWVWRPAPAPLWERIGPTFKSREMLVLVSACIAAALVWLARTGAGPAPLRRTPAPARTATAPPVAATPAPATQPPAAPSTAAAPAAPSPAAPLRATPFPSHIRERHETARALLEAGRLREAQDEYLTIMLSYGGSDDAGAMRGLVAVRRRMANDDPVLLRRQAQEYRRAIALKTETEEHYTSQAMGLLAQACESAAKEIETRRRTTR